MRQATERSVHVRERLACRLRPHGSTGMSSSAQRHRWQLCLWRRLWATGLWPTQTGRLCIAAWWLGLLVSSAPGRRFPPCARAQLWITSCAHANASRPKQDSQPISSPCIRQLAGKLELGEFALQLAVIFPVFRSQISKPENSENEGG